MTPTWVHFDRRYGTPACSGTTSGYPTCRRGDKNTYVLILQDALNALGYSTKTLDGAFGPEHVCCPARRPAQLQPDGRRGVRLQHLEKADLRRGGHRPHENRD